MSNQNVPINIFSSARAQRSYDKQDEPRVAEIIQREILSKARVSYHAVRVKVRRTSDGSPKSLIAYLLRKDSYTADVQKIDVDKDYKVTGVQERYDDSSDAEETDQEDTESRYSPETYGNYDFVAGTPVPEIPTAKQAVEFIHNLAIAAGLRSRTLLGPEASVANYQGYLGSGLQGFVNIGHGNPSCIVLADGTLSAAWFQGLPIDALTGVGIYFNSCQVYNPPLQPAIMHAGTRTFIGGILSLGIGPSEEVCKCFWSQSLNPPQIPMGPTLKSCEAKHYPTKDAHGIGGDLGQFLAGHVVVFQHIDFRGHHRHIFAAERNLNHPEDNSLNDKISSFVVMSGTWKFYMHANYGTPLGGAYGPGLYRWVEAVGIKNDQLSSLKCIKS
ncbi:MAG TPA: beta/gamma crystallin-related protein [Candidatus Paceibacterota bacterium]|nr:beta/gamma crystallin-related protein [Verrucomicrobiota bacterium]HRY47029.1 beta/gamma crystallin-related protein [Candidatus Paceibacterota bacterium]HSA00864.1 beta/gamma crystallin-related protein [Candidatus Paceibacterota bacterium]